jgi:hypothetical protein
LSCGRATPRCRPIAQVRSSNSCCAQAFARQALDERGAEAVLRFVERTPDRRKRGPKAKSRWR